MLLKFLRSKEDAFLKINFEKYKDYLHTVISEINECSKHFSELQRTYLSNIYTPLHEFSLSKLGNLQNAGLNLTLLHGNRTVHAQITSEAYVPPNVLHCSHIHHTNDSSTTTRTTTTTITMTKTKLVPCFLKYILNNWKWNLCFLLQNCA